MAIGYMIGIVLADGRKTLYRDPRAKIEEDRPATIFFTPTQAMMMLPALPWRKCGPDPDNIEAYGKRGEIYYLIQFDTASILRPLRLPPSKLTTGRPPT